MKSRLFGITFLSLGLLCSATQVVGCAGSDEEQASDSEVDVADITALKDNRAILKAVFDELIRHQPTFAGIAGVHDFDDVIDDLSAAEFTKHYARMAQLGKKLDAISFDTLKEDEHLAYDIAQGMVRKAAARKAAKAHLWEVSSIVDIADDLTMLPSITQIKSKKDVDNVLARYKKMGVCLKQRQANLAAGMRQSLVASKDVITAQVGTLRSYSGAKVADGSPFASVNLTFDAAVSAADKAAWSAAIDQAVDAEVVPAFLGYADFLEQTLLPAGRTTYGYAGLGKLGSDYYLSMVAYNTGSSLTAETIHTLGQQRVTEIEAAMKADFQVLGVNEPTLSASLAKVKSLPEWKDPTEAEAKVYVDNLMNSLVAPAWSKNVWGFKTVAKPTVKFIADRSSSAYYVTGASSFTLFTKGTPLHANDAVVTHEFTHYLQDLAMAQSAGSTPITPYLPIFGGSSLSEGGAHYAEDIQFKSGGYTRATPRLTALTRLSAESNLMLRAVRLVVDTGIHAKAWARPDAVKYMKDRVLMDDGAIAYEVDRYASWPGQALAYRLGMEGINSIKDKTKTRMGRSFSEPKFNQLVLSLSGGSLSILEKRAALLK